MKKTNKKTTRKNVTTKVEKARKIFKQMFGKKKYGRQDILKRFRKEVKLTELGAATYYYNLTKEVK